MMSSLTNHLAQQLVDDRLRVAERRRTIAGPLPRARTSVLPRR
jgi:hypothetical protein